MQGTGDAPVVFYRKFPVKKQMQHDRQSHRVSTEGGIMIHGIKFRKISPDCYLFNTPINYRKRFEDNADGAQKPECT